MKFTVALAFVLICLGVCGQSNAQVFLPQSQLTVIPRPESNSLELKIRLPESKKLPNGMDYSQFVAFDIFATTKPATNASGLLLKGWTFVRRTHFGEMDVWLTNVWSSPPTFLLGTLLDSDNDGLSDAYEVLTSHTNPKLWDSSGSGVGDGDRMGPNGLPWRLEEVRRVSAVIFANKHIATQSGAFGECTVYLPRPSPVGGTKVQFYVGGSAVIGEDCKLSTVDNQLFIPAGKSQGTIKIFPPPGKSYSDLDLYVDITLTNAGSFYPDGHPAHVDIATVGLPGIRVFAFPPWIRSPSITWGTNNDAGFYFIRDGDSTNALKATIAVGGTAIVGQDRAAMPSAIYFPSNGRTNWLPLNILSRHAITDKTVQLKIIDAPGYTPDPSNSTATIVIGASGRLAPELQVVATVPRARVGVPGQFTFYRLGPTNQALEFDIWVEGERSMAGQVAIYQGLPNKITIPAGARKTILPLVPKYSPTKGIWVTVTISLAGNFEYEVGKRGSAAVWIEPKAPQK